MIIVDDVTVRKSFSSCSCFKRAARILFCVVEVFIVDDELIDSVGVIVVVAAVVKLKNDLVNGNLGAGARNIGITNVGGEA